MQYNRFNTVTSLIFQNNSGQTYREPGNEQVTTEIPLML